MEAYLEGYYNADAARADRDAVIADRKQRAFETGIDNDYFRTYIAEVEVAAKDGQSNVVIYPQTEEYYAECVANSGGYVPSEGKDFSDEQKAAFDALSTLGFHCVHSQQPPLFFKGMNPDLVEPVTGMCIYTIYW